MGENQFFTSLLRAILVVSCLLFTLTPLPSGNSKPHLTWEAWILSVLRQLKFGMYLQVLPLSPSLSSPFFLFFSPLFSFPLCWWKSQETAPTCVSCRTSIHNISKGYMLTVDTLWPGHPPPLSLYPLPAYFSCPRVVLGLPRHSPASGPGTVSSAWEHIPTAASFISFPFLLKCHLSKAFPHQLIYLGHTPHIS